MTKPYIKHHTNRNDYLLAGKTWVRDFTTNVKAVDLNHLIAVEDRRLVMENEYANLSMQIPFVGDEHFGSYTKCLIVSDGYGFMEKRHILHELPKDVCVIGTNRVLAKWKTNEAGIVKRRLDFFVANNPYKECMGILPDHNYRPRCIVSLRTYPNFVKRYKGTLYYYEPTRSLAFGKRRTPAIVIDDYRNPICAAIGLSYHFGVRKLGLLCCDDSFEGERPAAIKLPNELWTYPQHQMSHAIIDANLYWLKQQEDVAVEVVNHSSGPEYQWANYIQEDKVIEFFE